MNRVLSLFLFALMFAPAIAQSQGQEVGAEIGRILRATAPLIKIPEPKPKPAEPELEPTGGRELVVWAYAYCLRGQTASGRYTRHGIIAVDPRVIPLGSKLYVPGYGWGIAADTGGAIKGNKIDLWKPTAADCYSWGVRQVRIKVFP